MDKQLISEAKRMQKLAGISSKLNKTKEKLSEAPAMGSPVAAAPSDVKALSKAQQSATTVASRAKAINTAPEFGGAFESWFKTLGFEPGKISKGIVRSEVEKVLTKLGYK